MRFKIGDQVIVPHYDGKTVFEVVGEPDNLHLYTYSVQCFHRGALTFFSFFEDEMSPAPTSAAIPQASPRPGRALVLDAVLADLKERADVGRQKYGTLLETNKGRDALMDAYQEALDLVMYLKQTLMEREA